MLSLFSRLRPSSHTLKIVRIVMFTLLHVVHIVLIGLLSASVATNPGALFEAITMAVDWVALISLALSLACSIRKFNVFLEQQYAKAWVGDLRGFICCGFFSLGNAIAFSVRSRAKQSCVDFSGITKTCNIANFVLALSWATVLFSIAGALARFLDLDGFEQAQPSPEHYHAQTVEVHLRQSPTRPPNQGLKAEPSMPLSHKSSYRVPRAPPSPTRTTAYGLSRSAAPKTALSPVASTADNTDTEYWTIIPV